MDQVQVPGLPGAPPPGATRRPMVPPTSGDDQLRSIELVVAYDLFSLHAANGAKTAVIPAAHSKDGTR